MQASLQFPAVLERLSLHAFDFRKIIQPFMRHEPGLPREMKRHLLALDEKILEAAAWTRNSSLYTCLALACRPALSGPPGPLEHQASGVQALTFTYFAPACHLWGGFIAPLLHLFDTWMHSASILVGLTYGVLHVAHRISPLALRSPCVLEAQASDAKGFTST